jgi:hypothetical protein
VHFVLESAIDAACSMASQCLLPSRVVVVS